VTPFGKRRHATSVLSNLKTLLETGPALPHTAPHMAPQA
jgi:hypothetical protein